MKTKRTPAEKALSLALVMATPGLAARLGLAGAK